MKKLLKSKWFITLIVLLLLAAGAVLSLIPGSPVKNLLKPVQLVGSPSQSIVKRAGDTITDFWSAITDGVAIREENRALKEQIADLRYHLTQNEEAALRYEELKEALHIKDMFSNYVIYGASILSRESDEWFSTIRLNAGKADGIVLEEGNSYPVLDVEMNLVGRVIEVGPDGDAGLLRRRVATMTKTGAWAEHVIVEARDSVLVPDGVSSEEAETVVVNGVTAWQMLHRTARMKPGFWPVIFAIKSAVAALIFARRPCWSLMNQRNIFM